MDLGLKQKRFTPVFEQIAYFKERFPQLESGVDTEALERVLSKATVPSDEKSFFFPFVLPKLGKILGEGNPVVFLELQLLDWLRGVCDRQGIDLHIDRNFLNGESLIAEGEGYQAYFDLCKRQRGDFVVFLGQIGHARPYQERSALMSLCKNEHFLPVGLLAALLSTQKQIERFWAADRNRWSAAPGSGKTTGETQQNTFDVPCMNFSWNFGGERNSLDVSPLRELFYYNPCCKNSGGLASAIFPL